MIPKIIHYCWFGRNPLPTMAKKCIASWKKYCPDYEIIEWNETNFDINYNRYVKEAYEAQKWAFVSDVVRLYALVSYGGIYMDTDVELLKPLDDYLNYHGFSGFESSGKISTGIMACEQDNNLFKEFLNEYEDVSFLKKDGSFNFETNVERITRNCLKYGLILDNSKQYINGVLFFPSEYFCPKDFVTRETYLTKNTVCIHHFDGSWLPKSVRRKIKIKDSLGPQLSKIISRFISLFRKKK